jgi:hypothetical protein
MLIGEKRLEEAIEMEMRNAITCNVLKFSIDENKAK